MAESSDAGTGPEREETGVREITDEEFQDILDAHKAWVESRHKKGKRADLRYVNLEEVQLPAVNLQEADLQGTNLRGANLKGANLKEANLQKANLTKAILEGATLEGATLQGVTLERAELLDVYLEGADLTGVDLSRAQLGGAGLKDVILQGAVLTNANLTRAKGLQDGQLAGTDLSGAELPDDIAKFHGLEHAAEISKQARTVFLSVIGACLFCWLTMGTMTDKGLLMNSVTTPLPVIQTKVPALGFFVAAPAILLGLYLYLHLYLQNLWLCLSRLPAIFPDGRPLDQRAFPWLLVALVRSYVTLLKKNRPNLSRLQVFVSVISAWVLAPFTAFLLWFGHLPRFYWISKDASWLVNGGLTTIMAVMAGFGMNSYLLAGQTLRGAGTQNGPRRASLSWATGLLFLLFLCLAVLLPYNFWIRGPLPRWFRADLQRANLARVDLSNTNLQSAFLSDAKLERTNLYRANLAGAFLFVANLQKANLHGANLYGAKLRGANLMWANLKGANLRGADLRGADLQGAHHLTQELLDEACGDERTKLPDGLTIKPFEEKKPDEEKEGEKKKIEP